MGDEAGTLLDSGHTLLQHMGGEDWHGILLAYAPYAEYDRTCAANMLNSARHAFMFAS